MARSPEYRKNEMIMLEEFRRRKMQKDYFEILDRKAKDAFAEKGESQYTNDFS